MMEVPNKNKVYYISHLLILGIMRKNPFCQNIILIVSAANHYQIIFFVIDF